MSLAPYQGCHRLLSCLILVLSQPRVRRVRLAVLSLVPLLMLGACGQSPVPSLMSIVTQGTAEAVKQALTKGADVNAPDTKGFTPLMAAAEKGLTPTVQLLLDKGADVSEKEPKQGKTALMLAAANGHTKAVQALLAKGAELNTIPDGFDFAGTGLHYAALNGHRPMVEYLLAHGADRSIKDTKVNSTAAGWAEHGGHHDLLDLLR